MLQIVLAGEDFEDLSKEKRLALVNIFKEGILVRTVGKSEVDKSLEILSSAGFDIWRGLTSPTEESD